jgi:hypothetical protein
MPDFDGDPDCDEPEASIFGLNPREPFVFAFGLAPEQAVALARRLLELAEPLLDD